MLDYGTGENLYWDPAHHEVRFTVPDRGRVRLFRVEREALEEYCGAHGDPEVYVQAARINFAFITHRISDKLSLDLTEPDGSVLIRVKDWGSS